MRLQELAARWRWKPLRNCPGRFVLIARNNRTSPETLLDGHARPRTFTSPGAQDQVVVVELEDGGLISYARPDGTFVHTLNTRDGFARKLSQLGIVLCRSDLP